MIPALIVLFALLAAYGAWRCAVAWYEILEHDNN